MRHTVLCVDTPDRIERLEVTVDEREQLRTVTATTREEVTAALEERTIACVVTGYTLDSGEFGGLAVADAIREHSPQTPCVLYSEVPVGEIDTSEFEELVVEFLDRERSNADETLQFVVEDVIEHTVTAQVGHLTPADEQQRLAALDRYDVDGLPVEESFDRVSGLISDHFDAAVAFVGLVKREQEEFLGCAGGDLQSVTRENSMCTHAILQEDVMTVEDIAEDKRFAENEVLHNFGIRSYAGANLTTPDGHVIGSVCVLDTEPRTFDETERATLQEYADTVMELLELRRQVADETVDSREEVAG